MSTVAEQLRSARESRKLTINQLAEMTKIRTDHIRALEEGNFDSFSAPVYIRGFVRNCATLLKLDVPRVMAALDAELGQTSKFREPPPLGEQHKQPVDFVMLQLSKLTWQKGMIALGAAAVIVICFSIWSARRHSRTADPLAGLKPGVYQSGQNNSGETLSVPSPAPRK